MTSTSTPTPQSPASFGGWGQFFDEYAPVYEASAFGGEGLAVVGRRERDAVLGALAGRTPGTVLDAGAGTGRLARVLDGAGWSVTALDVSREMLAALMRSLPTCETVHGTLGAPLPLPDAAFDAVVSMRVLKYVADLDTALREIARVLRPGGRAVLEFPNRWSVARLGYRGAPVRFVGIREVTALLEHAGFEVVGRVAGPRLPQPVWARATSRRTAALATRIDRAIAGVLGGDGRLLGARSLILVGERG
jgi:ubiquinone/menaquinone biosynthesis C-methylase UbiE